MELRPLTRADVTAWNELLAAVEEQDRTGEHFSEADLLELMANPDVEVGKDFVGAFDGDTMVGFFSVYPRGEGEGHLTIHLEGAVRPSRRGEGIGGRLVDAMLARSREARRERRPDLPAKLLVHGLADNQQQADLLASRGMAPERWSFMMRTALADVPAPPPVPSGYSIRQCDDDLARRMLDAHNAAFSGDHPNFTPWTEAMWKQWVTESRSFRRDLSYVVTPSDRDEIVAYVQTAEWDAGFEATGRREAYVAKVGTLREHRGRGLAAALLGHCLVAYRDAGYDESALDVDSANPSGALGVYERAGFEVESRWAGYALLVDA